ncbi:hypothetical protein KR018_003078 [Drosophila ironensis]|nr:hypothetical protein KR018_003078 [Drosophila ironensis]
MLNSWIVLLTFLFGVVLVQGQFRYHRHLGYSPELISDLREFGKLIPSATIGELVAAHMLTDSGFRKAIEFLEGSDFKRLKQRTESLPEVVELINFVHLNDTAAAQSERYHHLHHHRYHHRYQHRHQHRHHHWHHHRHNRLRRELENEPREVVFVVLLDFGQLSSFTSFVQQVLTHLPRDRFVALIKQKRQSSPIFAKFYEAIKSTEFKTKVEAAWNTTNVQSVIRELSGHAINSQDLKTIGFEVLSWGPA